MSNSMWGNRAVPGDKVHVTPSPLGGRHSEVQYSSGPSFDLTPKDPALCDVLPSPYGPPYGKQSGG